MRVLFITRAHNPAAGGMERLSWELAQALQKDPRIQFDLIAHRGLTKTAPLFVLFSLPLALWKARRADRVHLGDPVLSLTGWLIKKIWRRPIVVTVHGLDVSYPSAFYRLYLKFFFRYFDYYLPISRHADQLLDPWRVTGKRVVLTPGVTDRYYDPSITRSQLDTLLKQPTAGLKVLLTVGRLIPRKGHAWFIANVLPQLPQNYIYVIAGTGPQEKLLTGERVVLLGRVSDADLKILYNTVDAFIQPNIPVKDDAEGFGLVLLEAALCNRPVFAVTIDGIPDAIHHGHNGVLIESGNAPQWVATLEQRWPALSSPRQYTLERFAWPAVVNRYLTTLQKIL